MASLRKPQPTVDAMMRHYEDVAEDSRRPHLGGSLIGNECERKLWYIFRWAKRVYHRGRMLKLFARGHNEEHTFIRELKNIGIEVIELDPKTNEQWKVSAVRGHFKGSFDGKALGVIEAPKTWHLTEFKTHNEESYEMIAGKIINKLQHYDNNIRKGGQLIKISKPEHYAQQQVYMYLDGNLTRSLYLAVNKDTDEVYSERVKLDTAFAKKMLIKAERIIDASVPPIKQFKDTYYKCGAKWCEFRNICHFDAMPDRNCRTCLYSTPADDAEWTCGKYNKVIPEDDQRKHHKCHRFIPALVPQKQIDVDGENIIYEDWTDNGKCDYTLKTLSVSRD